MKRFTSIALLTAAMLVCSASNALSAPQKKQVKLYPPANSPFRYATGTVTMYLSSKPLFYDGVSVSVSKLAPNASYYMPVEVYTSSGTGVFNVLIRTDARGNGEGGFSRFGYFVISQSFDIYDPSDPSTGIVVLSSNPDA